MNAYAYNAALLCEDCAEEPLQTLEPHEDSDRYPQGPIPNGGGEADSPACCDNCRVFLENPLTSDGVEYVLEALEELQFHDHPVLRRWGSFYGLLVGQDC